MKRKSNRKVVRPPSQFDFQALEPRNLLAGLAGFHQMPASLPTGINLVVNGEFSDFQAGSVDNFFRADQVPGWNVIGLEGEDQLDYQLNIIPYQGLGFVLDLDSTAFNFDRIYQDIPTETGRQYLIAFDFSAHPALSGQLEGPQITERTADFEVWWDGVKVGTFTSNEQWKTGTIWVTGGSGSTSRLMFSEIAEGASGGGDGLGALLNNVRVVAAVTSSIRNGGFENVSGQPTDGKYRNQDIDGWDAIGPSPAQRGVQIETPVAGEPQPRHGARMLNLNANDNFRDAVFQDFATEAGATYYVRFFARSEHGEQLRVRWNDQWATSLRPGDQWQSYGILVQADSASSQLMFLEGDQQSQNILIDTVSLVRIDSKGVNRTPVVQQFPDQLVEFGQPVTFPIVASDPDGDALFYSLQSSGILASQNFPGISQNGQIQWTPTQAGNFELTVRATDGFGAFQEMSFFVTVSPFVPLSGTGALSEVPPQFRNNVYSSVSQTWPDQRPPLTIDVTREYQAVLATTAGQFTLRLFPDKAPVAVNSFVALAQDGFYDGLKFHRVIEGFVAQGGDPLGTGQGGPGYRFIDEVNNGLVFDRAGILAMANAGPGTNGSQFFITYGATPWLNNLHTIFGEILGDPTSFNNIVLTNTSGNQPIPGAIPTIINSITINVV
jgi:cyclophilin family peptidyl-prolyl cis-trans isomerase